VTDDTATIVGTAEPGSTLQINGEEVEVAGDGSFSHEVAVSIENETFTLTAHDAAGNSSEEVIVIIIAGSPSPTMEEPTSPTNDSPQTLRGSKLNSIGIVLRADGADPGTVVPPDANESWEFDLDLQLGTNTFYVSGVSDKGHPSCEELGPFTIIYTDVCAADVNDDFPAATTNPVLPVTGTRCEGVSVHWRWEDQAIGDATESVSLADEAEWSFDLDLREGMNVFYVHYRDDEDAPGPEAGPFTVILDTTPPNPPTFDPEPEAQMIEGRVDLQGAKDEDTNLCLRRDQEPECTEVVPINAAGDWSATDVPVLVGENFLCISSADRAGNTSEETCVTVTGVPNQRPTIFIDEPRDGSAINEAPFRVRATVTDSNGLAEVQICLDDDCAEATDIGGDQFERTITPGDFENGSAHLVIVRAENDFGGDAEASVTVNFLVGGVLISDLTPRQEAAQPRVAVDGQGRVHVVWEDYCSEEEDCEVLVPNNFPPDILHRMYDGGAWSEITTISDAEGDALSTAADIVADSNGDIHVVWSDTGDIDSNGSDSDIYHRSFDNGEGEWGDINIISAGSTSEDFGAAIAARSDGTLYAVWQRRVQDFPGDIDIFGAAWAGNGWTVPTVISDHEADAVSRNPDVAIDNIGTVYITWQEDIDDDDDERIDRREIMVRWVDGEDSGPVELVSRNPNGGLALLPRVATSSLNEAHILWQDTGDNIAIPRAGDDWDIVRNRYSRDDGFVQGNAYTLITLNSDEFSGDAAISVNPATDNEFIVWTEEDADANDADIFYSHVFFGAPDPPTKVSTGDAFNVGSDTADVLYHTESNTLHIVWVDQGDIDTSGDDADIYYLAITIEDF
jgi:hypothetical protein